VRDFFTKCAGNLAEVRFWLKSKAAHAEARLNLAQPVGRNQNENREQKGLLRKQGSWDL
jgi:hypothetical protein